MGETEVEMMEIQYSCMKLSNKIKIFNLKIRNRSGKGSMIWGNNRDSSRVKVI